MRRIKEDLQEIVMQRFADSLLNNHSRDLWSEVMKINGERAVPASSVDGCLTEESIAELLANK
jgi:hypothetical protein